MLKILFNKLICYFFKTIINSNFAIRGAGIYAFNARLFIEDSELTENVVTGGQGGGAIYFNCGGDLEDFDIYVGSYVESIGGIYSSKNNFSQFLQNKRNKKKWGYAGRYFYNSSDRSSGWSGKFYAL